MNPNADLGRSSAAQVNLVTKGGTNDFHGAGFEFYRSVGMTANNFFNNRAVPEVPRTPLLRHTFGGEVDGPIIKNKLFFMYSYEGRRDTTATNVVRTVPLASPGQGQLRYVDANGATQTLTPSQLNAIFPAVGISPTAAAILGDAAKRYPANDFTVGDKLNTGGYRFNAPTPVNLNSNILKLDWNVSSKQTAFVRLAKLFDLVGVAAQFPDTPAPNTWTHSSGIAVGHTWTLNPRIVNSFRYGLTLSLDMGLNKSINLGKNENRRLELRWEVFNVTNTQRFGAQDASRSGWGITYDPAARNASPPANWSNFTGIQGNPRIMQIGARFQF